MDELEKQFLAQVVTSSDRPAPTERQMSTLLSRVAFIYPDYATTEIVNKLLELTWTQAHRAHEQTHQSREFLAHCARFRFIGFSFQEIATKQLRNGERKKRPMGYPPWRDITLDNYEHFVLPHHRAFAFRTGRVSGITVLDCDTQEAYDSLVRDFPQLSNTLTVRTRQGAHMYLRYEEQAKTGVQCFTSYRDVDVRSDMGIVFAPPTSYDFFGTQVKYTFVNNDAPLVEFPRPLLADRKPQVSDEIKFDDGCHVESVDDLCKKQVADLIELIDPETPFVKRTPLVSNMVYEVGVSQGVYYFKAHKMMMFRVRDLVTLKKEVEPFAKDITLEVYSTDGALHVYCLSHEFVCNSGTAMKLLKKFGCTDEECRMVYGNGWCTELNRETFIETLGSAESVPYLKNLLHYKVALDPSSLCGAPPNVGELFISFDMDPPRQTQDVPEI